MEVRVGNEVKIREQRSPNSELEVRERGIPGCSLKPGYPKVPFPEQEPRGRSSFIIITS